jgi:tetratricopeptide (TPR) repeat protein
MSRFITVLLFGCLVVQMGVSQTVTQDSLETMLGRAKTHYYNGEYENAITELEKALLYLRQLKRTDQVEAYKYLAFSYVAFGNRIKAKEQFRKALVLDPELELDPATVSPKIIKVFEETKAEMAAAPVEPSEPTPTVYRGERRGFDATIRSCCVGGWGQMYRGESSKGKKMMLAWGTTLGATVVSWIIASNREEEYLNLRAHDAPYDDAYNKYKIWYNIAWVNTGIFLGVHAYNLYDIIFREPSTRTSMSEFDRGFICEASKNYIKLGYEVKF